LSKRKNKKNRLIKLKTEQLAIERPSQSNAPNVRAAMDQGRGNVIQGIISLVCGLAIGFYFGWKMTLIESANLFKFLAFQFYLVELQKRRTIADAEALDGVFRISAE
jgi:hypothetical protein